MNPIARLSGLSLLFVPAALAAADQLQLRVLPPGGEGAADDGGTAELVAQLQAVDAHRELFEMASWLFYAGAVLTIPMTIVLWRLAAGRAPRWAWAGALLGAVSVVGQFVQAYAHFGVDQAFSGLEDRQVAAEHIVAIDSNAYALVLFLHYLIGVAFAVPVAAIALKRAGVIPWWGLGSVLGGSVLLVVLGSTSVVTIVWAAGLVIGLAPAVRAWGRGEWADRPAAAQVGVPATMDA